MIGADPVTLQTTVAKFNHYARTGTDPEFGSGYNPYSRFTEDQEHKPKPSLGPWDSASFYAVKIPYGDLCTLCGLGTNTNAQVLNQCGEPIPGLYAIGLDMNSIFQGH